jgi:hypothetical protein
MPELIVSNINYQTSETKLLGFFEAWKIPVTRSHMPLDASGAHRRFAFITVEPEHVEPAVALSGKFVDGNPMRIKRKGLETKRRRRPKPAEEPPPLWDGRD